MITLTAQPADKGTFEQLSVQPISLGAPMFARYGYAGCVNNMDLDVASPKPARQLEAVPAGLESDSDPFDHVSYLLRFLSPKREGWILATRNREMSPPRASSRL